MEHSNACLAILSVGFFLCLLGCAALSPSDPGQISRQHYGTADGLSVELFTLRNTRGVEVKISNYGGIVVSFKVPDRQGRMGDVVLGFDSLDEYVKHNPFFGCLVGRFGNRIAKGKFTLNGTEYSLPINNGPNSLHGGLKGFDKKVWQARPLSSRNGPALELHYVSKNGEEGFPGTLAVTAVYTLTEDNGLRLDYTATTDQDTIVNLTQHSYFNLLGRGDILGHEVMIVADHFTPTNSTQIPTGELRPVAGTPLDFRKATPIGARIEDQDEQMKFGHGYDHNFVLNKPPGQLSLAARVYEPDSGRVLEVLTTEPAMQFYTGNFLNGIKGKNGMVYEARNAFCMEPQHFPDSPNHDHFPSVVLKPGDIYKNTIIYQFSTR
jgi:aldose 1-epimerase